MSHALTFLNLKSRSGAEHAEAAEKTLRQRGIELILANECEALDYSRRAELHRGQFDLIIVGGGDGSVKCAAQAALAMKVPLAILPLGTANNFARSIGIPASIEEACALISDENRRRVDVGLVNGELLVSVCGIGLSTQVHKTTPVHLKRRFGPIAYAVKALRWVRAGKGFRVEIRTPRMTFRDRAIQVTICNGKYFGGHLEIQEDASVSDHELHLLLVKSDSPLRGMLSVLGRRDKGIRRIASSSFEIRTWPPMEIDVEGSVAARTPAKFEILPGALEVFAPRS